MQLTHRDDPSRTASVTYATDDGSAAVVEYDDSNGTRRKKSFKKRYAMQANDAATRFLLNKERFIVQAQEHGALRWMARLLQDYVGEVGHAVDRETGLVWVHDGEDRVHRITPGTCETVTVALQSGNRSPGASVATGADGSAWCLAPDWDRVGDGLRRRYRLYRVQGTEVLSTSKVAEMAGPDLISNLTATADGRVLGPGEGGAVLYGPDGKVIRPFSCAAPEKSQPAAAISRNGEWVACFQSDAVVLRPMGGGEARTLPADFTQVDNLHVTDDGIVFVAGFRYPSWGVYRLGEAPQRVSEDHRAVLSADGSELVEARRNRIVLRDPRRDSDDEMELTAVLAEASFPILGMAKAGRAAFGPGRHVVVMTDAYTVGAIDLDRLPQT